ncbi:MAG: 3-deoxy-D-manno-octulosonic acid transferase, partial [Terriglobia bacterium]
MLFFIYSVLFTIGVLLMTPYYVWRYRGSGFVRSALRERFGHLGFQLLRPGAIWVHAVSVGETLAVSGLVRELQRRDPGQKIYLSHITPTGREAGEKRLPEVAGRFYLPLDWRTAVCRTLQRLRPKLLLIVETELWPNLLRAAHESGAIVVLVNARLSDRSFRGYRIFRPFMRRVLENVDWIFAQTPQDAERFIEIGAQPEHVEAIGNLKFDAPPPPNCALALLLKEALAAIPRTPVLVAASTMPGEEELVLKVWNAIRRYYPGALLVLAPRHPSRFDAVAKLLRETNLQFIRRTDLAMDKPRLVREIATPEILMLDTIGELAGVFEVADVVAMGGSLTPTGGHNPVEPAQCGKP